MEINPWMIVVIGILAAAAGYVFRILDSRVTTALVEAREKAPAEEDEKPTAKLDEHSVLKVSVDPALKWHLELDGARLEPDGLTAEQRKRLVNVIVQIRPWIDGKTVAPPVPAPAPVSESPAAAVPLVASAPIGTQPAALRLDIGRGFRSLLESDIKKPEPPKVASIVGMIDEVLQKKLENSPLAGKRIRLEEGSVGEVIVFVGTLRYSGVDAVPDEDIKAIIRAAIAEWDKK